MSVRRYLWIAPILIVAITCFSLVGKGLRAQSPAPGYAAPAARAPLAPSEIDTTISRVYVHVDKTGFGHEHGVVSLLRSGHLALGANQDAGELVFDMTSFQADTDEARKYVGLEGSTDASTRQQVNANMLGPDVLDVKQYPTAVFKVTSIQPIRSRRPNAPQQLQLDGDFTLHGTTNKISLIANPIPANGYTRLVGHFSILQSDYGIKPFRKALGAVGVADRLTIWGDLWIAR